MTATAMLALTASLSLMLPGGARAAETSYDCAKASHEIEILVCGDETLAARDRRLAEVYSSAEAMVAKQADAQTALPTFRSLQRGWVGGKNECWKSDDKLGCTRESYDRRIAELQATYRLVDPTKSATYRCDDNSEVVASFFPTDLPSVVLERGDQTVVGLLSPSGSGARYEADFAIQIWIKGTDAEVEWPEGVQLSCKIAG